MFTKIVTALMTVIFVGAASDAVAKSRAPAKGRLQMSVVTAKANPHMTAAERAAFARHRPYGF